MRRENWEARQAKKHEVIAVNSLARSKRSPNEQLAILDKRLGVNIGAAKERARLAKALEVKATVVTKKPIEEKAAEPKPKLKAKERRSKEK